MFTRLAAHCYEIKCNHVYLSRLNRSKIVGETEVFAATLLSRLSREGKSHPFRFLIILINDQVVARRLTREIAVNELCLKQLFAYRFGLDLGKFRINGLF